MRHRTDTYAGDRPIPLRMRVVAG